MLIAAGLCPHPPLLLDGLRGAVDPVPRLRAACAEVAAALRRWAEDAGARVVVVAAGPRTRTHSPDEPNAAPAFLGPGRPGGPVGSVGLPYAVGLGHQLLAAAGCRVDGLQAVATHAAVADCLRLGAALAAGPIPVVLLMLADGAGRRMLHAPGAPDPEADEFDAAWLAAVSQADPGALLRLEPARARELRCEGRAVLQVLAGAALGGGPLEAGVLHADCPFGVQYVVATWHTCRRSR